MSQLVRERHRRANVEIVSSILLWKGPLRDVRKMNGSNDGKRSLVESIMLPQVIAALKDWLTAVRADAVLIGGVAAVLLREAILYGRHRFSVCVGGRCAGGRARIRSSQRPSGSSLQESKFIVSTPQNWSPCRCLHARRLRGTAAVLAKAFETATHAEYASAEREVCVT